ncbi:hypothetical protein GF356_11410, partial [candidate division GN15 bacterium]|nr:hypothetical protein [candidate division GN15 bacterium]
MRRIGAVTLLLFLAVVLCQCSDSNVINNDPDQIPQYTIANLTAEDRELLGAGAEFAPEIFRRVCDAKKPDENVFISPLSISIAMGMAHAGAAGSTQDALQTGLRLPANMTLEQINESYQSIMRVLPGLDPKTTVSLANAVWYRQQLSLHAGFEIICREHFEAEIKGMDFNDNRTVDTINNWVYDKTRGKIESIVRAPLAANTMAILTNAIYFKGDWKYAFDPQDTESRPFTTVGGDQVMADMMYLNTDSLLDTGT